MTSSMDDTVEIAGLLANLNECQALLAAKHRELLSAIEQRKAVEVSRLQAEADALSASCVAILEKVQQALNQARKRVAGH